MGKALVEYIVHGVPWTVYAAAQMTDNLLVE